jgi:hypothetical protein
MTRLQTHPHDVIELLGEYRQRAREFREACERDDGRAKADASARMTEIEEEIQETGYRITPEPPLKPGERYRIERVDTDNA